MTEQNNNIQHPIEEDEIDLIALAKTLWKGKKTIISLTLTGMVLGFAIALLSPKEYTSNTIVVPQTGSGSSSKLGGLSSLASLAGVNLGSLNASEALSPVVYPQIMQSVPFQLELMNTEFQFQELEQPVKLYDYYTEYATPGILAGIKKYTIGLPRVIWTALKPQAESSLPKEGSDGGASQLIYISEDQQELMKTLQKNINLEINDKDGYINLSASFHDAALSAQVVKKVLEMLQEYVTSYKLEKASDQLDFVNERYEEKKQEFKKAQEELAMFRDRNKNVSTAMAQTEEDRLESEYNLAYSVYSELATQLETAKIQVKEDTPILTVIEPVRVPVEKSAPNRPLILFIGIFLGAAAGVGLVFGKQFLADVKVKWNEEETPAKHQNGFKTIEGQTKKQHTPKPFMTN